MQGTEETGDSHMRADTQVVVISYPFKVTVHNFVRQWVARINRVSKTDRDGEDDTANLVRKSSHSKSRVKSQHTSVSMRDFPVPELWTTEMALA